MNDFVAPHWPTVGGYWPSWFHANLEQLSEAWNTTAAVAARCTGAQSLPPTPVDASFAEVIEHVRYTPECSVLVGTDSGWTAVYHSPRDSAVFGYGFAALVPCEVVKVYFSPEGRDPDIGEARGFRYVRRAQLAADGIGLWASDTRSVQVRQGKARYFFDSFGAPLSFEDLDRYNAGRRRDRLTNEMLLAYVDNLGIPRDLPRAYRGAVSVYGRTWPPGRRPRLSAERQQRLELDQIALARIQGRD